MGNNYSIEDDGVFGRVCPYDCDEEKFKMVLDLFTELEGVNIIDSLDIQDIAEEHVKTKITLLNNTKIKKTLEFNKEIENLDNEYDKKRMDLEQELINKAKDILEENIRKTDIIDEKIRILNKMNRGTRGEMFLSSVTKNALLNFWQFYEYIKQRIDDDKNVRFFHLNTIEK